MANTIQNDQLAIDNLTKAFFEVFTNLNQQTPNWNSLYQTCIPEITIIKKEGLQQEVYDLEHFIAPRRKILEDGTLTNFEEREVNNETTIISNIAQRISRYQKSGILNGVPFNQFGNKLFQFIKTKQGWKINAVTWEDD